MAAPAQTLVNCSGQKTPDTGDHQVQIGITSPKNGVKLDDINSDDVSGNGVVNSVVKSPNTTSGNQTREMKMENFQDGGTHLLNSSLSRPMSGNSGMSFPSVMDKQRLNSEYQGYGKNSRDSTLCSSEDYRNSHEGLNHISMGNYSTGYIDRSNYIADQHGDQGMSVNAVAMSSNPQPQHKVYSHYNQSHLRPGFQHSARTVSVGASQRPSSAAITVYHNTTQQQRLLSGQAISQQGGPTPTLNQLLQAPNPLQRYQNSYSDYNANQAVQKGVGETNSSPTHFTANSPPQGWGALKSSVNLSQQVAGGVYRSQGGSVSDPTLKRPYINSGQQASTPSVPQVPQSHAQGQYGQHYIHRTYSQHQSPTTQPRSITQGFSQQVGSHFGTQEVTASQVTSFEQRASSQIGSYTQSQRQNQQDVSSNLDDIQTEPTSGGGASTPGLRTPGTPPTSQNQGQASHPGLSPHRLVPSPSGSSSGSRSMSPAIGQQQSISMPPRPSSSQSDSSGPSHISQPMTPQGYNQQLAHSPVYGSKVHQSVIGNTSQVVYTQQSGHFSHGTFTRAQGTLAAQGYGTQSQNNYQGAVTTAYSSMATSRISNHTAAASQNFAGPANSTYMNSQYGVSPSHSVYGINSIMPPPSQFSKSNMPPPAGGAQASTQGGVMAVTVNSSNMRSSQIYSRQQIQQKVYNPGYGNIQPQTISTAGNLVSTLPTHSVASNIALSASSVHSNQEDLAMMPAISNTPSQPLNMTRSSPHPPPTVSTPLTMGPASGSDSPTTGISIAPSGFTQTSAPSVGPPTTTVTQSIGSPVPSVSLTVSSPGSGSGSFDSQQPHKYHQQGRSPGPVPQLPQLPTVLDEGSQASNTSASSSIPDDHNSLKANMKSTLSHPPTPNTLPSPGAVSMSSFHDEFESLSSPSWPRTPASPVVNNQGFEHHLIKRPDGLLKLYDMSDDPERRAFLDKLILFNEERGAPMNQCPTISKQPLDLYRLYIAVKERGGFLDVTNSKQWKDCAGAVGIGASSSAAYTLRKQYIKHLLQFECKFDRGGIDPQPIIKQAEASSRKKSTKNTSAAGSIQEPYPAVPGNQIMDKYSPSSVSGAFVPAGSPHSSGMMEYASPHHSSYSQTSHHPRSIPNHHMGASGDSMNLQDPFIDDMQTSQYHHTSETYNNYTQSPGNAMVPPFSGTQSNVSSNSYGYPGTSPLTQHEVYPEQYSSHNNMIPSSESNFNNRSVVQDPYGTTNSYPPNRTVNQHGSLQYHYQGPCDRESNVRFEHQQPHQSNLVQPAHPSVGSVAPSQTEPTAYSPQRYSGQQITQEVVSTQQSFQNRQSLSHNQYPAGTGQPTTQTQFPQSQPQQDSFRVKSDTIGTYQNYPGSQQNIYNQSSSQSSKAVSQNTPHRDVYPRDVYSGPKHPDFNKIHVPGQDQFHIGSYNQQQSQTHYSDHSHYPYRGVPVPQSTTSGTQQGWSRDSQYRQYQTSSGQSQYPHNQRDTWEGARHSEGHPSGPSSWSATRCISHHSDGYSPHVGNTTSSPGPKGTYPRDRVYMPSSKIVHSGSTPSSQYLPTQTRKEIVFPADSVEAVTPVMSKRRRLMAKDVSPLEAWRIMMALKSGLLAETTWALDVLSVLLYDDSTILYFGLNHLPGFLETLIEHYRYCLSLIFSLTDDLEVGYDSTCKKNVGEVDKQDKKWYITGQDPPLLDVVSVKSVNKKDRIHVLDMENFTNKTRCGKIVKLKPDESLFLLEPQNKWDFYEGFTSGTDHWQFGGGDMTLHIQTNFDNMVNFVRFVRVMDNVVKDKKVVVKSDNCEKDENNSDISDKISECKVNVIDHKIKHLKIPLVNCKREPIVVLENLNLCKITKEDRTEIKSTLSSPEQKTNESVKSVCEIKEEARQCEEDKNQHVSVNNFVNNSLQDSECTVKQCVDEEKSENETDYPKVKVHSSRKRTISGDLEEEIYTPDEPSLMSIGDAHDALARRCICISSLLRNLSFVPGNDTEMSKHAGFLLVMGRLLLLHHMHSPRKPPQCHYDKEEEGENTSAADSCSSLNGEQEWWWDMLHVLRENTLVTLANVACQLDLAPYPEEISLPILDGLLHWAVCPSSYAQDPLPTQPPHSVLSPQRLSLEALCKLSIFGNNVDLMLATPPWLRIEHLFAFLTRSLNRGEDQVMREFSVVLLSNLSQADSSAARAIALHGSCISQLIAFVEQAEQSAFQVASSQGMNALRENPELMGTTLDMVRKAAGTLRCLACVPENRSLFLQNQQRLLALVMSQILDQGVASIVADVLYECSHEDAETSTSLAVS